MKSIPLVLPSLGDDAATSGEIMGLSAAGAALKSGDIYMEVETDKVVVEVPADADGVISCLAVSIGDTVTGADADRFPGFIKKSIEQPATLLINT